MEYLRSPYVFVPFLGYLTTSITLFLFPTLIHKRTRYAEQTLNRALDNPRSVLVIAHRGGSRIGLENTLETFTRCGEVSSSDMLEMDVCLTKNNRLVVHHDTSLKRTCNRDELIDFFDYEQLPTFSEVIALDFGYRLTTKSTGQKIPLLESVFEAFPDKLMNIQLKTPSVEAIEELDGLIRKYKRESKTVWGIRGPLHQCLKKTNPSTLTFFDERQVLRLLLLFVTGLLPFSKIPDDSLQIPIWTDDYYNWKLDTTSNKLQIRAWFTGLKFFNLIITPIIGHLQKRGIMTIGWVCNEEEQYDRALRMGCCGIMTDRPDHLEEYLARKFK